MTEALARTLSGTHVTGRAHDILLVALIALRPLVWSGDASALDNLAWLLLALIALVWLVVDAWRGRLPAWRFGIGGVLGAALLLILLPAALRSPYPSTGMGLWGMAVIHLGFAAYLMQVIPGRERLAFGALAGALTVECLIALGQWVWVLPKMAAALAGGDPTIAALENANGDLANRVAYGGLFGTFTLANTLAAFLLLAAVPFIGVLQVGRGIQRLITGVLLAIALIVAVGTASKGAAVALVLAGALVWTMHVTGRLRWLAMIGLVIGGIAIAIIPQVRDLGAASAKVRLGYWEGATTLIAESPLLGHGINGFAAHGTRTMPLDAEPTRHVHNDVLEAAVDGGVLAGLAMLTLLGWCTRRRTIVPTTSTSDPNEAKRTWQATWPLLLIFPVFSALGMLTSNVEWWPLGASEMTWWLWPLILSGVVIGVAVLSTRLPLPPAWAWQLALAAFVLHCLVDFNLQSPAIWGTVIVVAILAGGRTYTVGMCSISRCVVTGLVLLCAFGYLSGWTHALERALSRLQLAAFAEEHADSKKDADSRRLFGLQHLDAASRWPSDPVLALEALRLIPAGTDRLPLSMQMAEQRPWSSQLHECQALDHLAMGDWQNAADALRIAITQNPAYLPRRQLLVELLEHAAKAQPDSAATWLQAATDERQRITELSPLVHPRNRLRKPPTLGLPVQPAPQ
jgi:O-Antigen ligase